MEWQELEDDSDELGSSGADSGPEEQTSDSEEGKKDMTGNTKLADECDVETKGVAGENGEIAVTDMATTDDVGLEDNSVSIIKT